MVKKEEGKEKLEVWETSSSEDEIEKTILSKRLSRTVVEGQKRVKI